MPRFGETAEAVALYDDYIGFGPVHKDKTLKFVLPKPSKNDIERFFCRVEILDSGCWYWFGARSRGRGNTKWYGSFRYGNTTVRAHRFICELVGKGCPPGYERDHTCNFSLCVNPDHIEVIPCTVNQSRRKERVSVRATILSAFYDLLRMGGYDV